MPTFPKISYLYLSHVTTLKDLQKCVYVLTLTGFLESFQAYGKMACYTSIERHPFNIERNCEKERKSWTMDSRGTSVVLASIDVSWANCWLSMNAAVKIDGTITDK
jgi:hypothetical protein